MALAGTTWPSMARSERPTEAARPFRMGFTPWPPEMSAEGLETAARFIDRHADMVSLMLIGGLPWQEALDGAPFSADVRRQLAYRPPKGHRLFLSISPLNMDRGGLAPYWGQKDNLPLPAAWAGRRFDSPEVIQALAAFTLRAVDALKPGVLAIGVESNVLLSRDREAWPRYKTMHRAVYLAVKRAHPMLPVCFTTEVNHYLERATEARDTGQAAEVAQLMRWSDLFAMSYYPHMSWDTRWPIPDDFLGFARRSGKPIAVSETGMLSRPVTVRGIALRGSEADQRQYYDALLRAAMRDRYRFVVTFCTTDYDKLLPAIPAAARDLASIWTYTGLQASDGRAKPALALWDRYLAMPLEAASRAAARR